MTLEENVVMGIPGNKSELHERLTEIVSQLGWKLDFNRTARTLSIAEQQLVEILRGLMRSARVMFFDEPTSSLTFDEVNSLFKIIKELQKKKVSVIYITHRLNEVFVIANRIALLIDGTITMNGDVKDFTYDMLLKGLAPDSASKVHVEDISAAPAKRELVLSLKNFSGYGFSDINLDVYSGEVLGMTGVVGAGKTELATTVYGRDKVLGGKAYLNGEDITGLKTKRIIEKGINYLPEDRFLNGIFKLTTVRNNITPVRLACLKRILINTTYEKSLAEKVAVLLQQNTGPEEITVEELVYFGRYPRKKWFEGYGQKDRAVTEKVMRLTNTFSIKDKVLDNLSGGERQRAWIAMCLAQEPSVILFDEPTVYLDLAHQIEFFKLIADLKKETEAAIILVLHDLNQAAKYGNYLVAIKNGTVFAEGKPEAVLTRGNINAIYNIDSEILKTEDGFFVIPK